MNLVLKIQVSSKVFTKLYFGVMLPACYLNLRNVRQHLKHLEPTARLTTTDVWQSILIETYWIYWKASRFCKSELNLSIFVLFEGKANEIYSAVGWHPKQTRELKITLYRGKFTNVNMLWSIWGVCKTRNTPEHPRNTPEQPRNTPGTSHNTPEHPRNSKEHTRNTKNSGQRSDCLRID